jgi:glucose uptake protein
VITNYVAAPVGNLSLLAPGVMLVTLAIILDAVAYRRLQGGATGVSTKGLVLSVACGVLMGTFYRFVAAAMYADPLLAEPGKMSSYAAVFVFAVGIFLSNFVWNTLVMKKPFVGAPVGFSDYFKGSFNTHLTGILGGAIWGLGMSLNMIASGRAGFAISYGLGQGATMVAAFWGVFIWREFRTAPKGTSGLIAAMFACFLSGLALIVLARTL